MAHSNKNLTNLGPTLPIKIIALFFGFYLWYVIGMHHSVIITKKVPLVFYNKQTSILEAPDMVTVQLRCSRKEFSRLIHTLAVHIDAQQLELGKNSVSLKREQLFVTPSIDVIHYIPTAITVTRTS